MKQFLRSLPARVLASVLVLGLVFQPLSVLVDPPQVYAAGSVSDSYADSSKIDGSNSSNQSVAGGQIRIGASNYFGDGSDGDVTISANTNLTVPNKNGSYDGDMVVKEYNSLTINSGVTLTTDQPLKPSSGTNQDGTWQAQLKLKDSYDYNYYIKFDLQSSTGNYQGGMTFRP